VITHDQIQELLGAFALDAVDDAERRSIEAHLAGCEECRAEVAAHRETGALLVGDDEPGPARVWERIREQVHAEPAPPVAFRPRRETRLRRAVAALAAAAVLVVGILGWRVFDLQRRLDDGGVAAAAAEALEDPDATQLELTSPDGAVTVEAVLLPDGRGYVVEDNLQVLSDDRTYQLWALGGDAPVSAGLLGADPEVTAFRVGPGTDGLAVTVEAASGAVAPTADPIAVAQIS
jgi:hypothetical protein